jgi:hypothetical protein
MSIDMAIVPLVKVGTVSVMKAVVLFYWGGAITAALVGVALGTAGGMRE